MSQEDRFVLKEAFEQQHRKDQPTLEADKYFELFASEQILKARGHDLDPDQLASGIVGGGGDGGVDSFYVFANRRLVREDTDLKSFRDQQIAFDLVIIQAQNAASFEEVRLTKLKDFTENCLRISSDLSKASRTLYSNRLLDAVAIFHELYRQSVLTRPSLSIGYYYASFGEQIHRNVTTRAELLRASAVSNFSAAQCEVVLAGAKELLKWFYDAPVSTVALETSKTMYWGNSGKAYVCLVSLANFAAFITNKGSLRSYMFEANVRDYQGDVTVNKQIARTLSTQGSEEFWWLNNGVTILASEARLDGDRMSITNPLIVNGLQTSHEIFNHSRLTSFDGDNRTLLVRIIEASDESSVDNIISATNSQTSIPRIWLHATESIHRKIETVLRKVDLYYDRRKNFQRNQGVAVGNIITMPYLAQALAAIVLQKPDDARARPTTVSEKQYTRLFSEEYPIELYSKCALVIRRISEFLDKIGFERNEKLNILFHLAMYATSAALKSPNPRRPTIARMDIGKLDDVFLKDAADRVYSQYFAFGGDDKASKGPAFAAALQAELRDRFGRKDTLRA
jgi:hypothetical protein